MKFQAGEIKSSSSLTIRSIVRHLVFACCSHQGQVFPLLLFVIIIILKSNMKTLFLAFSNQQQHDHHHSFRKELSTDKDGCQSNLMLALLGQLLFWLLHNYSFFLFIQSYSTVHHSLTYVSHSP